MGDKVSGYNLKTVFHDKDKIDISNTEDGGTTYDESQGAELDTFITYLGTVVKNIYNLDGTLLSDRIITAATFFTKWIDGDVIVNTGELTERGFTVNAFNDTERARLRFNQADQSGELSLTDSAGVFLNSSGGFTSMGGATQLNGTQLGIKAPDNSAVSYSMNSVNLDGTNILRHVNNASIIIGSAAGSNLGTSNIGLDTISPNANAYHALMSSKEGDIAGYHTNTFSGAGGLGGFVSGIKTIITSDQATMFGGNHTVNIGSNGITSYGVRALVHINNKAHTGITYGGLFQNAHVGGSAVSSNITFGLSAENILATSAGAATATKMIGFKSLCNINSNGTATDVTALEVAIINTGTITNTPVVASFMGGNMGIGTVTPNRAALLDMVSTTTGFSPPKMTTTQRDNIVSPPASLIIYNTTTSKLNVFTTVWEAVTSA